MVGIFSFYFLLFELTLVLYDMKTNAEGSEGSFDLALN